MKTIKRLAAIVCCLTLLIGIPLATDVAAVTTGSEQFELLQATRMTADMASAYTDGGTTVTQDNGIALYFNGMTGNSGASYYVAAVNGAGEIKTTWAVSVGSGYLFRNEGNNHVGGLYWYLKDTTWAVVDAAVAKGGDYEGCTLKFLLVEDNQYTETKTYSGAKADDGIVDDFFRNKQSGTANGTAWSTTNGAVDGSDNATTQFLKANTTYGTDKRDAVMVDIDDNESQFQITAATLVGDDTVVIYFNDAVDPDSITKNELWAGLRVVDSNKNLLDNTQVQLTNLSVSNDGLRITGTLASSYQDTIGAYMETTENTEATVCFVMEELAGNVNDDDMDLGEVRKNWVVDTVWNTKHQPLKANKIAPYANKNRDASINDSFYIPLSVAIAQNGDALYEDLSEALKEARANDTVTVVADTMATERFTEVPAGVTLDLNGHTVTAANIVAFGHVTDTKDGEGALIVSNDPAKAVVHLQASNPALPLYDTNGYRFFTYSVTGFETVQSGENWCKFGININFNTFKAYELLASDENAELTMDITVGTQNIPYKFNRTTLVTLRDYVNPDAENSIWETRERVAVSLKISGLDSLGSGTTITAIPVLSSAGATKTADAISYTYNK